MFVNITEDVFRENIRKSYLIYYDTNMLFYIIHISCVEHNIQSDCYTNRRTKRVELRPFPFGLVGFEQMTLVEQLHSIVVFHGNMKAWPT